MNKGLTEVQGQLERLAGKKKYLEQSSSLSTLTATFSTERHLSWQPLRVAREAGWALLTCLQLLGSAAIIAAIFTPLWGPVVWWLRRRRAR